MKQSPQDFANPSFLEKFALQLIKARKCHYAEDCMNYYFQQSKFTVQELPNIKNKYNHLLKCTLVKHKLSLLQKVQHDFSMNKNLDFHNNQPCIIYLHGLGSNRLQGFSIVPYLPKNYSLLTFDLSGSGKSEGEYTTYGFKQKQDIQTLLIYLYKNKNIREFIIWGRSMGAVASLLFNNVLAQKQNQTTPQETNPTKSNFNHTNLSKVYKCVKCIVADSPFSSFQEISKDIALKKMSIPNFFTDIALNFLKNIFQNILFDSNLRKNFTPFQIDFTKSCLKPVVPIVFIYSLNDEIVSCVHSQRIIKSIQKSKIRMIEKIIIPECGHNLRRPENVIQSVFHKIQRYLFKQKCEINKKKQLSQKDTINNVADQKNNQNYLAQMTFNQSKQINVRSVTKSVRRKSFWNFQDEFQCSSNSKYHQQHNKNLDSQKTENQITQKVTVRRSIFNRNQSQMNEKYSKVKKRGLSLSSTIEKVQRHEKTQKQTKQNDQKILFLKSSNNRDDRKSTLDNYGHNRKRNFSTQLQQNPKCFQQFSFKQCPRKEQFRENVLLLGSKCEQKSTKRSTLGGSCKNRLSLGGGSVQKRTNKGQQLQSTLQMSKLLRNSFNCNFTQPAEKDTTDEGNVFKHLLVSKNSSNSLKINSYRNKNNQCQKSINNCLNNINPITQGINMVEIQKVFSEPNISSEEQQSEINGLASRQSLKTIDLELLNNEVNEEITTFINKKLEFKDSEKSSLTTLHQKTNNNILKTAFTKYASIQLGGSPRKNKSMKQSVISSGSKQRISITKDKKQRQSWIGYQDFQNNCFSKTSTINSSNQMSFRPSSRLYHEKRKKKMLIQTSFNNKIIESEKITNQRYLAEE